MFGMTLLERCVPDTEAARVPPRPPLYVQEAIMPPLDVQL
jgi:hypothetical protein